MSEASQEVAVASFFLSLKELGYDFVAFFFSWRLAGYVVVAVGQVVVLG